MDDASHGRIASIVAVSFAALLMTWPMFYNGFPLLYPDSVYYLQDGGRVARALFLREFVGYYGPRSAWYALGIYPFHWNVTVRPVVFLNAVLVSYVLWLSLRSLGTRWLPLAHVALVAFLSAATTLAWYVSFVMPDVLGPVLYLAIFLLAFCWESLSRVERVAVGLAAWWAMVSHASHLPIGGMLCAVVGLVLVVLGRSRRECLSATARVGAVVAAAVIGQLALYAYLYDGELTLTGRPFPVLLARIVADGPGRWYLEEHCGELELAICDHVEKLDTNAHDFLFAADGVYQSISHRKQRGLVDEQMRVVIGTIREYPWEQLRISAANSWNQLFDFGLGVFTPRQMVRDMLGESLKPGRPEYLQSRQDRQALQEGFFDSLQLSVVAASVLAIAACALLLEWRRRERLVGFAVVTLSAVIGNAIVTATLSMVDSRYQARVIWMVPMLAAVMGAAWWQQRRRGAARRAG